MKSLLKAVRPVGHAGLAALLLIILMASAAPLSAQSQSLRARRIWKGETDNICCYSPPKPSPDGRYIPGVDWSSGDLAYLDLQQDQWVRVSDTGGWNESGDFSMNAIYSPDGTQMAHSWLTMASGSWDLRVVDVDGENTRVLISPSDSEQWWPLDWSPSGRFILAAHSFEGPVPGTYGFQFLLVPANGGEVTVIKEFDPTVNHNSTFARFSPDGQWIAYTDYAGEPPLADVRILSLNGRVDRGLVTGNGDDKLMDWLPDGSGILFHSERKLTEAIWRLPVRDGSATREPELIRGDAWGMIPMGFGPAGFYYGVPTEAPQVYTAAFDLQRGELISGPNPVRDLSAGTGKLPAWSPDGRQLAFLSQSSPIGRPDLVIQSLETGETHTLLLPFDNPTGMFWVPDGHTLTLTAAYQGVWGLHRFDLQSGEVTTVLTPGELGSMTVLGGPSGFDLSTDGRTLLYRSSSADGGRELRARELETGRERVITRWDEGKAQFREIPGGEGYVGMRGVMDGDTRLRIIVVSADGSETRTLWEGPREFDAPQMRVTADGKYILLAGSLKDGTFVLLSFDLERGERREIFRGPEGDPTGAMTQISLHPDGSRISFFRGIGKGEIWVMEGLER